MTADNEGDRPSSPARATRPPVTPGLPPVLDYRRRGDPLPPIEAFDEGSPVIAIQIFAGIGLVVVAFALFGSMGKSSVFVLSQVALLVLAIVTVTRRPTRPFGLTMLVTLGLIWIVFISICG
jgi:hypothetical protein